mmetsp:Transcript_20209/g.42399  ORF Transcript_20209/g.42399 Transcript_20209/m.42399 type:complete len:116 (-) Transcript_20209:765-1112(-)
MKHQHPLARLPRAAQLLFCCQSKEPDYDAPLSIVQKIQNDPHVSRKILPYSRKHQINIFHCFSAVSPDIIVLISPKTHHQNSPPSSRDTGCKNSKPQKSKKNPEELTTPHLPTHS